MDDNRYAPPKAMVEGARIEAGPSPAIWNPNAAASWCLLFSPIFGTWLHMKNWQALGEPERAKSARIWFFAAIATLVITVGLQFVNVAPDGVLRAVNFGFLIGWYYGGAKPQVVFVKSRWGDDYVRRGWSLPLLTALGITIGLFLLIVLSVTFGRV